MRIETIEKLCCPFDRSNLELTAITRDLDDSIINGMLKCNACKRVYPIVYGIPIMSPDEYRNAELEQPLIQQSGIETTTDEQGKTV